MQQQDNTTKQLIASQGNGRAFHVHAPQVMRYSPELDSNRRYLTDSLTPQQLAALFTQVDSGDVAAMIELNEEMEGKDAHLQAVASLRRDSITALEWSLEPEKGLPEDQTEFALEVAATCESQLRKVRGWEGTLKHFATAIGPGIAVTELVWRRGLLHETVDVPGHRLMSDPWESDKLFIETGGAWGTGIETVYGKFVVFTPNERAGFPIRVTITRAQGLLYLIKHYSIADWVAFSETFGTPFRVAEYDDETGVPEETKKALEDTLRDMAAGHYAVVPKGVSFQFIEAGKGSSPFDALVERAEKCQTILYLGQTLTTDTQGVGSFALGQVHANVKASILASDIKNEREAIREQILKPMVALKYPRRPAPIPQFRRITQEEKNIEEDKVAMDKLRLARELGLPVDKAVQYEMLRIPMPKENVDEPRTDGG